VKIGGAGTAVGTGGMSTKLEAAAIATGAGIPVMLAAAERVGDALAGTGGTLFTASSTRTASRLFWLRHATTPRGRLVLDAGAVRAVVERRASLLPAGITGVAGEFGSGDAVEIVDPNGVVVARGLVAFDSDDLPAMFGKSSPDLPVELRREVVHRDDIVLLSGPG
jgi:glutamate 5-kinase